jgi:hypothetical protein
MSTLKATEILCEHFECTVGNDNVKTKVRVRRYRDDTLSIRISISLSYLK